tara:strand:- start:199 stop:414 length:216 start_codon:yes stop_codon:yes gene_type:complete
LRLAIDFLPVSYNWFFRIRNIYIVIGSVLFVEMIQHGGQGNNFRPESLIVPKDHLLGVSEPAMNFSTGVPP